MAAKISLETLQQDLRLPLVVAPMFLVSGPDLVVAASQSGALGAFPISNTRKIEDLESWLAQISGALGNLGTENYKPWGLAITVHRTNSRFDDEIALVKKYQVPLVITALGGPARAVAHIHSYGGLVLADVNSVVYAKKAAANGVDGLALVASGAGGHTGLMSPFPLVSAIRQFWDGIVMLGGGISNGRALASAELLGANLIAMGTRFIAAEESMAETGYKQMLVDCDSDDLLVTKAFTGANASMMRPSIIAQGLDPDLLNAREKMDFRGHNSEIKPWKGIWSAGQGLGEIDSIQPAVDIIANIDREYRDTLQAVKS